MSDVDIALVSLQVPVSSIDRAVELLDDGERSAASARTGDVRRRYVVAHAATRVLIGERLEVDPARVVMHLEPGGRPIVEGVAFSLSHSGDLAAVALTAPGLAIGVDIERVQARVYLERLAERVFTAAELDWWRVLAPSDQLWHFTQRWTEFEAVLKARGTGIVGGLASARELESGWSREAFDAGTGYVGTVAVDASPITLTTRVVRIGDALTRRDGTAR